MDKNMLQIILENLPWPIIALAIIILFRKDIEKLIDRIKKVKGGGLDISMEHGQPTTIDSSPKGLKASESPETTVHSPTNLNIKTDNTQAIEDNVDSKSEENDTNPKLKEAEDLLSTISSQSLITYENSIRNDLEELKTDKSKQIEILIKALASTQGKLYYQSIHNVIWGSQLSLLRYLNTSPKGSSLEVLKVYYDLGAEKTPNMYTNYNFEQYLEYLIGNHLMEKQDNCYFITQLGIDYLSYLTFYGIKDPIPY